MRFAVAWLYLAFVFGLFAHCLSSYVQRAENTAEVSARGGFRLLRNPGKDVKRLHELLRGDILEQTSDNSDSEKFCGSSALDMDERASDEKQASGMGELESLSPFSDLSKAWLQRLHYLTSNAWAAGLLEDSAPISNGKTPKLSSAHLASPLQTPQNLTSEAEAKVKSMLTTWNCLKAHGSNYGEIDPRMTCKFKNLYVEHGAFVAHTLCSSGISSVPRMSFGVGSDFKDMAREHSSAFDVRVVQHSSLHDFEREVLNRTSVQNLSGLSLAFVPLYHFNVGHGLFDGLYPAFVSLLQHGEEGTPFRPVLVGGRIAEISEKCPLCYQHVEDIFSLIGGVQTTSTQELSAKKADALYRFDQIVIGIGTNSAKIDMNVNFTLGACREIDACRAFRKRVFDFAHVPLRPNVRETGPFKVTVVEGKRFTSSWQSLAEWLHNESNKSLPELSVDRVVWTPADKQKDAKINPKSVQLGDFRSHLEIISQTDIFISSPGTAMMYQTFLPEGAVLINMGDDHFSYMEEYMAEGAPYLRALYYPIRKSSAGTLLYEETQMRSLFKETHRLLTSGFTPTPVNQNLSPMGKFYKAFAYWKHEQVVSREILARDVPPQRAFQDIDWLGNEFLGPQKFAAWCCHKNGTFAGVMHGLAKAYQDAHPEQGRFFEDFLIRPSLPSQYTHDLSEYRILAGFV